MSGFLGSDVGKMSDDNSGATLLVGFPSNGLVGTFTTSYIVHKLGMEQVGELDHPDIPPTLFVENGEILAPIRIYKKGSLFVIISDVPFDPFVALDFADSVLNYCKRSNVKRVVFVSGIEKTTVENKEPRIFGLVTHRTLDEVLYKNGVSKFASGSIFGTDAAVITTFRKSKIPLMVLYTECHPFFPDPEASVVATSTLARILGVDVDTEEIKNRIERLRIQHRNLMEDTIKALKQTEGEKGAKTPQIYR